MKTVYSVSKVVIVSVAINDFPTEGSVYHLHGTYKQVLEELEKLQNLDEGTKKDLLLDLRND